MKLLFGLFFIATLVLTHPITAAFAKNTSCQDRYVTLVNPVRGRNLWIDKSIDPIAKQYSKIRQYNLSATWLLQDDAIQDQELISFINKFESNQEKGVFLEVSKGLADKARVIYPYDIDYFSPKAVFLSAYSPLDRRRLVDRLFEDYKSQFGHYPKSVGAWWIDSYSLDYMQKKYKISAALIVADQKTTDNYGVWGQWWGVPYYPTRANILTPAPGLRDKLDVAVIQWAQRDPLLAIGEGPNYSRFSLQANDYTVQGKDTSYFINLVKTYLDCQNSVGQVTVGLETGMESVDFFAEYSNQIRELQKISDLKFVTMSQFADKFKNIYPDFPKSAIIDDGSKWSMNTAKRVNEKVNDHITYNANVAFKDYFIADNSRFLDRKLPQLENFTTKSYSLWWILLLGLMGVLLYQSKTLTRWLVAVLFSFTAFGLVLKSHYQFGWSIYYASQVPFLPLIQVGLIIYSFCLIEIVTKWRHFAKNQNFLWLLPLSFGIDPILQAARYSFISGRHYLGFAFDQLGFLGISFVKLPQISITMQDFPAYQAAALLRLHFSRVWEKPFSYFILYPLAHIILALVLSFVIFKMPQKIRILLWLVLISLFCWHIFNLIQAEPRYVAALNKL